MSSSSENAKAAVDMLNATQFGAQYSKAQFWSEDMQGDMQLAYQAALASIGSDDSNIPSTLFFNSALNLGGNRYKYMSVSSACVSRERAVDTPREGDCTTSKKKKRNELSILQGQETAHKRSAEGLSTRGVSTVPCYYP